MKYSLPLAAIPPLVAASDSLPENFKQGARWQVEILSPLQISNTTQKLIPDADIWDIDLWHVKKNPDIITQLHRLEKTVICYMNLGAVQPEDCDFTDWYKPGSAEDKWNGPWYYDANFDPNSTHNEDNRYCERYVNFTDTAVLDLMKGRLKTARDLGCDGVDPDNIDIAGITWGDNVEAPSPDKVADALEALAEHAHNMISTRGHRFLIGQKNGADLPARLAKTLDFAVLERCLEEGLCDKFGGYLAAGKPVIDIEYPASLQDETDETNKCNLNRKNDCDKGDEKCPCRDISGESFKKMDRVIKLDFTDYGLNGCTQYCDSGVVVTPTDTKTRNVCDDDFGGKCSEDPKRVENGCCK
ncbi:endo alpha-1,4 polygalactosaminidase [Cordyceps fumosorosea ARSEF 2679]|uniref:alpha-galactosidase n=1 Tax=Cordyceps fumosorosea (strain ARSEF 2679) TaxID=1081104 RepID=A0A167R0D9_CORFA|nr:endo alpha-1,4 polygalactosaminidase [Cordyceps fumosorosea ARSEF 2679]OAA58158.1 endo alpha-1,4 polygalactosaminidase [Cordyceps fumosorosea ARSEF 2679]